MNWGGGGGGGGGGSSGGSVSTECQVEGVECVRACVRARACVCVKRGGAVCPLNEAWGYDSASVYLSSWL